MARRRAPPRDGATAYAAAPLSERQQTHAAANAAAGARGAMRNATSKRPGDHDDELGGMRSVKRMREDARHAVDARAGHGPDASEAADPSAPGMRASHGRDPIHELIRCPITLEVMKCPVFASDGHTYEARAIESWLQDHPTSPVTREPMDSRSLRPNFSLRHLLSDLGHELEPPPPTDRAAPLCDMAATPTAASELALGSEAPWPILALRLTLELLLGAAFNAYAISHLSS